MSKRKIKKWVLWRVCSCVNPAVVSLILQLMGLSLSHSSTLPFSCLKAFKFIVVWGSLKYMYVHLCSIVMHGSSKWLGVTFGAEGSSISVEFCPPLPLSRSLDVVALLWMFSNHSLLAVQTWVYYSSKFIHLLQVLEPWNFRELWNGSKCVR